MQTKVFDSGCWTIFDRESRGLYSIKLYASNGDLREKVRCDSYGDALATWRAFNAKAERGQA